METYLNAQEQLIYKLRSLYKSHGYSQFRMSKFEPYDLYANNKDFLVSDSVITFTDTDGALLALKPDVTLSIVKNHRPIPGSVQKTYYNETVYRTDRSGQGYKEIMQTGLECVGDLDETAIIEVILLALQTLTSISGDFVLDISHMGILEEILSPLHAEPAQRAQLLACIEEKNEDALLSLPFAIPDKTKQQLLALLRVYGPLGAALEECAILQELDSYKQLLRLSEVLAGLNCSTRVNLDFSILGSRNYYNGFLFRGYVAQVPVSVISGGQYDRLMKKMGKSAKGIGFAVYLNHLEQYLSLDVSADYDTILLYDTTDTIKVLAAADALRKQGKQVLVSTQLPENSAQEILILKNGKVTSYEKNG